jgi:hypothetical protein
MPVHDRVAHVADLPASLARLGLAERRPVLVVSGSARRLAPAILPKLEHLIATEVVPVCQRTGSVVVDGGTDAGIMRLTGRCRAARRATFPLVGVVAAGTVDGPDAAVREPATLEPNHTHVLVVPGQDWGDESPWLAHVARTIAGDAPVAGLLLGGGDVSADDVHHLLAIPAPVFAVSGSGRLADALERASSDPRVRSLQASDLVEAVNAFDDPTLLRDRLERVLGAGGDAG